MVDANGKGNTIFFGDMAIIRSILFVVIAKRFNVGVIVVGVVFVI